MNLLTEVGDMTAQTQVPATTIYSPAQPMSERTARGTFTEGAGRCRGCCAEERGRRSNSDEDERPLTVVSSLMSAS